MKLLLSLSLLFLSAYLVSSNTLNATAPQQIPHILIPIPAQYTYGTNNITISSPCAFSIQVQASTQIPQIAQLITAYKGYMFPTCDPSTPEDPTAPNNVLKVQITNASQYLMNYGVNESYSLTVQDGTFNLVAATYIGFVRGLETFSQLLTTTTSGRTTTVSIPFTPVTIVDEPRFQHRGVMVDTARHFISKAKLLEVMDAMVSLKLNVFHWHISDSDSFPVYMPTHPNLNLYGAFSAEESYSQQDVQDIVNYAIVRGIKITPEVDSPSHVTSWGFDPEFANLLYCAQYMGYDGIPTGQLDPTLDATYNLASDIIKDLEAYFPWDTMHLGADEVYDSCWEVASVNTFMQQNNIATYNDLFQYYITRQGQFVDSQRSRIYWGNPATNFLKFQSNDIVQWWGNMTTLPDGIQTYPNNRFILSCYDYLYLDCGMGNYFGNPSWCDPFHTWADIYGLEPAGYLTADQLANVLGFEAIMFGELDNDSVIINKIFPRTASMAEKGWSPQQNNYTSSYSVFVRLNGWIQRSATRGIDTQPISAGYCEEHPDMCFS